jgi:catechol 2,3-dioxygenase-like lactoylglutathione lyase family enzyme
MKLRGVMETVVYARDLDAAEHFYAQVLGLELISREPGRHVFFRCGDGVYLIFNPLATSADSKLTAGTAVPRHGAHGPGHVAFRVHEAELFGWRDRLQAAGVAIEAEIAWPAGGRSIYFRDPAGNSIELATPSVWGFAETL